MGEPFKFPINSKGPKRLEKIYNVIVYNPRDPGPPSENGSMEPSSSDKVSQDPYLDVPGS